MKTKVTTILRRLTQMKMQNRRSVLKTLGRLGQEATPEQQLAIFRQMEREAVARRATMHRWTEQEIIRFIEAFKAQRPDQYAEYLRQEIDRSAIDAELGLEMDRFGASLFPYAWSLDIAPLKTKVRDHVRRSLNLKWEKWEDENV
jgi:hypothetical protein